MKYLSILLIALLPTSLSAQQGSAWHKAVVKEVHPFEDGSVMVRFANEHQNCTNTRTPEKNYHLAVGTNGVGELGFKNMYSALLTAATTGKEVTFLFDTASANCSIYNLKIAF